MQVLDLRGSGVGDAAAVTLAGALRHTKGIQQLLLARNKVCRTHSERPAALHHYLARCVALGV
eukprot:SAG11_NODE_4328_length_1946_cov_2.121819_4_plen_62_part_01